MPSTRTLYTPTASALAANVAAAVWRVVGVETPGMAPLVSRITLTLPMVNTSAQIVFLVTGDDKAEAVERVFSGPRDPRSPGSLVEGPVVALLDAAAAARL